MSERLIYCAPNGKVGFRFILRGLKLVGLFVYFSLVGLGLLVVYLWFTCGLLGGAKVLLILVYLHKILNYKGYICNINVFNSIFIMSDKKKLTYSIDENVAKDFKIECIHEGVEMSSTIESFMSFFVQSSRNKRLKEDE